MGPLFNPFFWFFGLIICVAALVVAALAGSLVRSLSTRHRRQSIHRPQTLLRFLPLFVGASVAIITFCGLSTWLFRDPSIPVVPPSDESIIGVWEMDDFSLTKMARDGGYTISTHTITFRADSTFKMINMPDWWLRPWRKSSKGFYSGTGTWYIQEFLGRWQVSLTFSDFNGHADRFTSYLAIGDWDGKRSIYYELTGADYLVSYKKRE